MKTAQERSLSAVTVKVRIACALLALVFELENVVLQLFKKVRIGCKEFFRILGPQNDVLGSL